MDNSIIKQTDIFQKCKATSNSLTIPDGLRFEEWEKLGHYLNFIESSVQWWIGDWLNYGEKKYGEMYTQVLDETNYKYGTLRDAKWISNKFELSFRKDNVSFTHHKEVASLEPKQREKLLNLAKKEDLSIKQLKTEVRNVKLQLVNPPQLPQNKYQVIYADPPWKYDFSETTTREIENQYPTMKLIDICNLNIKDISADDSVLLLWVTSPKLLEGIEVINSWGFNYRTSLVWVKDKIGMGYYVRSRHELLLIAKKGNLPVPQPSDRPDSAIMAKRGKHSKKPEIVYELIEKMYKQLKKIELFSRKERKGWKAWGNQVQ